MAYQVYFSNLDEENRALVLTLLRLKEDAGKLEPGEAALLTAIRGYSSPPPPPSSTRRRGGGHSPNGATLDVDDED